MLKKIERVLIRVKDVSTAADFYASVFSLRPIWRNEQEDSAGFLLAQEDTELVLLYDAHQAGQIEIHYLVDDVISALRRYTDQGCRVIIQPFETDKGLCASIEDPFGGRFIIRDLSKAATEMEEPL